ncbi:hypothetical protein AKJ60_01145 [candidate division MSBL1 archaeon SCGC-AAA385M11]|nr:hypothetical protein AKJ60_01145 [candidate division MSBL1 archaeon SCGC-AAA385M11]
MRIYLDNCCFNRPFDDQTQLTINLETRAILAIQEKIIAGEYHLIWSYMLSFENAQNPRSLPRREIAKWRIYAKEPIIQESPSLLREARRLMEGGVELKDAIHVASAIIGESAYFITTDKKLLNKLSVQSKIKSANPIKFVEEMNL